MQQNKALTISVICVLVAAIGLGFIAPSFFNSSGPQDETLLSTTINPNAQISAEGYPLPSDAKEDVLITVTDTGDTFGYSSATVLYDYDTGEWEAAITDQLGLLNVVNATEGLYVLDIDSNEWFEIGQAEIADEFNIADIYFDESYVADFLSTSTFLNEVQCGSSLCAAWQVVIATPNQDDGGESIDTLTVRVDNGSRKIFDITAVGESSSYTISYVYQEVDIEPPSPLAPDPNIEIINLDKDGSVIPGEAQ